MKKFILAFVFSFLLAPSGTQAQELGILHLSVSPSFERSIPRNAVRVPFLTLWAYAKDGDVLISEITVKREGLSSFDDFKSVWAENSLFQRSSRVNFHQNDTATVVFPEGLLIPANSKEKIFIFANLNADVGRGRTAYLKLQKVTAESRLSEMPGQYQPYNTRQRRKLDQDRSSSYYRSGRFRRR